MTCHACGAQLSQGARFCHKCGAAVATAGATGWRAGFPWAIAGAALGALVTVVALRATGNRPGAGSTEQSASGSVLRAPDISQMSPEERANRLFNRVMSLSEAGSARIRRLPSHRAGGNGAQPARVRRPFRRADQLQGRSLSSNGSSFGHVTTRPVSRVPYPGIIRVAHSPDADDAFMFWAMATGKIDTGGRRYVHELADIETLNRRALSGELEVTAVSLHAYAYLADRYALLAHGASIGDRYGPRIVDSM